MKIATVLTQEMMARANRAIDRLVPPGGVPTFDSNGVAGFFGSADLTRRGSDAFGQADLVDRGSDAFGQADLVDRGSDAFGQADLVDRGSDAFGQADLVDSGSNAFAGLYDGLGRWAPFKGKGLISKFASKIGGIVRRKSSVAKVALKRVADEKKQTEVAAEKAFKQTKLTSNAYQRERLLKQANALIQRAEALKKQAEALAEQAVNPKITRGEFKAAAEPVVREVAEATADAQKQMISEAAELKKKDPVAAAVVAQNPGTIKTWWKNKFFANALPGARTDVRLTVEPGAGLKHGEIRTAVSAKSLPTPPQGKEWRLIPGTEQAVGRSQPTFKFVLLNKGQPMSPGIVEKAKQSGSIFSRLLPKSAAAEHPQVKTADLMFGMETVTQPVDYGDIVDTWQSDDVFSDSQGMF